MEAANLFAGDHDPSASNHLSLLELQLPSLEENMSDVVPTGAPIAVEVDTHILRLEATFILAGWQPQIMSLLGESDRMRGSYTAYGLVRDRRSGEALEARAIIEGRLGRVHPTNFRRGDVQNHEYSIRAITHYELYLAQIEIYWWDFFTSTRRVGLRDLNADMNRILRIMPAV
jgi:phage tail tube protein FII